MTKKTKETKPKRTVNRRRNMAPGEYRKRSTVYVERLRRDEDGPDGRYGDADLYETDAYIVVTHRMSTDWFHTVELKGQTFRLPGEVIERIISQREAIIKEQRKDRGAEVAARRKAAVSTKVEAVLEDIDMRGI